MKMFIGLIPEKKYKQETKSVFKTKTKNFYSSRTYLENMYFMRIRLKKIEKYLNINLRFSPHPQFIFYVALSAIER